MTNPKQILVVDDEPRVRRMLKTYLDGEGFSVREAEDGAAMRREMATARPDIVLLDLVIPGEDGLSLLRELRRVSDMPVIMITGHGDPIDRVAGLEAGADDYITKPFHLREVLARVRTVLRRSQERASDAPGTPAAAVPAATAVAFAGWRLDLDARELLDATGSMVPLTTGEFQLLAAFVRHPNRPLNRDQLMDLVRDRDWTPFDRSIDTQVGRLRKKIESDPKKPSLIKTVRGVGYVFTAKVTPGAPAG
ncbi:MAG: response regulator [Kiloniellales bacterium]|nr:response regulator [Kiloniellales bacterium]